MAIAILSGANGHVSASGTSGATTSAIDTTGATFLCALVSSYTNGPADSFSDSKSNSWTALTLQKSTSGNDRITIYYAANPTVGSGHTFTNAGASNFTAIAIMAFSGVATVSPLNVGSDVGVSDATCDTSVNTAHPGSLTVASGDLEISGITIPFGFTMGMLANSGFTVTETVNSGSTEGLAFAYVISSGGTINVGWNTTTSSLSVGTNAASFKAAAATTNTDPPFGQIGQPFINYFNSIVSY